MSPGRADLLRELDDQEDGVREKRVLRSVFSRAQSDYQDNLVVSRFYYNIALGSWVD